MKGERREGKDMGREGEGAKENDIKEGSREKEKKSKSTRRYTQLYPFSITSFFYINLL
jgi:hypothetical protein